MDKFKKFINGVKLVTKWALIGVAFVKALQIFLDEIEKIDVEKPKSENDEN